MKRIAFVFVAGTILYGLGGPQPAVGAPAVSTQRALTASVSVLGEVIVLRSLPRFTSRLLMPVVPGVMNSLSITDERIVRVLEVPPGFSLTTVGERLLVSAEKGDAWGYATVETPSRTLQLTLLALTPASKVRDGILDGYRIGSYRAEKLKGLDTYAPPLGFIRLTSANAGVRVSDRYTLRDFQCKLDGGSKFLVLRPEALLKLELMQERLERTRQLQFDRFTIMSGFRTPYYNARIGNETSYSRHLYGDAMDIYVDTNGDATMDDINRDGRVSHRDAALLLDVAEEIDQSLEWGWLKGGAGLYRANSSHGPFLHVDTRGFVARWGVAH